MFSLEDRIGASGPAVTKRKRTTHEVSLPEDIAWTAARCNRLLRTISSRINALRRLVRTDVSKYSDIVRPKKDLSSRRPEHWSAVDPVWLPNGTKKLKRRTYTAKKVAGPKQNMAHRNDQPTNIAFPSPFIRRIASDCNSTADGSPVSTRKSYAPKVRRSRTVPIKSSSEIQEAEKSLETAFVNLLSQTESAVKAPDTGPRSLFGACLRRMPAYIELEIEAAGDDNNQSEAVTSDVLSYLEDIGTSSCGGWPALREVARSQAIHLICRAVQDGFIRNDLGNALANNCALRGAHSEGQQIFQACLLHKSASDIASGLHEFCVVYGYHEYKYKTLCSLGLKDAATMSAALGLPGFCDALLGRLAASSRSAAWTYISELIVAFRDLERSNSSMNGPSLLLKDIVSKIVAMAAAGSLLAKPDTRGPALFEALNRVAAETAIVIAAKGMRWLSSNSAQLLMCSEFLLSLEDCGREPASVLTCESLFEALLVWRCPANRRADWRMWREKFVQELADAIMALEAHFNLDLVEKFLDRVLEVSKARSLAPGLLQEVSFALISHAKQSENAINRNACADFLQQMPAVMPVAAPQTPYRKSQSKRFRWEEGLSEWVLATPFIGSNLSTGHKKAEPLHGQEDGIDSSFDSGYCSPQVIVSCSPDVLAISPAGPVSKQRPKRARVELQANRAGRRKSRRILEQEDNLGSGDELGF